MNTRIEYIGRKPNFKDVLYGTSLTFVPGQVRELPSTLASKFLRHNDLFDRERVIAATQEQQDDQVQVSQQAAASKVADAKPGELGEAGKAQATQVDDTAAVLEAVQKQQDDQVQKEQERAGLLDQIRVMTKPELTTLAKDRWNQVLGKTLSVESARDRVIGFVDQYGVA